ncbi:MAG: hypothetical protein MUC50_02610 [Myxococcota bacterium]|nr:hypothetical protein [Myxococcota bacterium]
MDADFFVISLNNHVAGEYTVLSPTAPFDYEIFHTHALQARVTYYRAGRLTGLVDDRHMAWGGTVEVLTAPPQAFADWGKTPRAAIDIRVKVELAEEESRFEECIFDTPVNNEGELGQDSVRCECFGPDGTRFTCREENDEFVQCCQKDKPRTKLIDLTVTGVGECGWYCNQMMTIPLSYCDLCGEVYEDVGDNEYLCPFPDDTETGEACDGCESLANPRGVLSVRWADGSGEVDDGLYTAKHGPTEQELDRAMVVCGTLPEEYPHSSCFDVLSQETSHSIELSFKDGRTARAEVLVEAYDGCPYRNVSYQIVTVEEGVDGEITFEPVQFIDPCELMDLEESSPFQQIIQTPPFVSSKNRKPAALLLQENRAPLSGPLF